MGAGLHAAAENAETAHVWRGKGIEGDGGDGGGTHLGDEAAVHDGERLAGGAAQQFDDGHVGGQAEFTIAGVEGDGLYGHDVAGDGGHDGEPAVAIILGISGAEDGARRLGYEACRIADERLAYGGDEGLVGEDGVDFGLGDVHGVKNSGSDFDR